MKTGYVINVGVHGPQKAIVGEVTKDGYPKGNTTEVFIQVGTHGLINRARVWCRRVYPGGKLPVVDGTENQIEVIDPKYKGDLEFLKWGDNKTGAQAIEIRYLPHSSSLDYQYQDVVQKIQVRVEEGFDQIDLTPGQNKFDPVSQKNLVQMLKVHPQNRDSVSKNPDPKIKGHQFYEVSDDDADRQFVKHTEAAVVSQSFVINLSEHPQRLRNLFAILSGMNANFGDVNHLSNPTDIYASILKLAQTDPGGFGTMVNTYKKSLQDLFAKAESLKALDLSKDGFIAFEFAGKTTIIWDKVEAKGKKMPDWVIEHFLDEEVYDRTQHFKSLCDANLK